jgi:hypothetical protein
MARSIAAFASGVELAIHGCAIVDLPQCAATRMTMRWPGAV